MLHSAYRSSKAQGMVIYRALTYDRADRERHFFTYSLYPHQGDWASAQVDEMSLLLNQRPRAIACASSCDAFSLISVDKQNVVVSSVKKAYDSDQIIVRLNENMHSRSTVTLTCAYSLIQVSRCNLLEEEEERISHSENSFTFTIKPFEVVTLALKVRK